MSDLSRKVAEWLAAFPHVHNVTPVSVTIKGTVYSGARYKTTTKLDPSCRAYREGKRESTNEMIYLAGDLPACKRNGSVAFTVESDSREWYVAAYYPPYKGRNRQDAFDPASEFAPYHPFGNNFMLSPWDIADSKVDTGERVPYKRVAITIKDC